MSCSKDSQKSQSILRTILTMVLVLGLTVGMAGCNSLEDAVKKAKPLIPEGYEVVHLEQVDDNSAIVFYTLEDELSAGIFTKNTFGWSWIGSGMGKLVTYPEGLQWRYAELGEKDKTEYSLYYGKINNKDIEKVTVKTLKDELYEGTIVNTEKMRLWYAFTDEPQVPSVSAVITGYSKDDKVIYLFSQPKENKEDQ